MIDEWTRVRTPIRAIELLEAIKNFLDVPKCVFVLAVDYAVIQQGVADRLKDVNDNNCMESHTSTRSSLSSVQHAHHGVSNGQLHPWTFGMGSLQNYCV